MEDGSGVVSDHINSMVEDVVMVCRPILRPQIASIDRQRQKTSIAEGVLAELPLGDTGFFASVGLYWLFEV